MLSRCHQDTYQIANGLISGGNSRVDGEGLYKLTLR